MNRILHLKRVTDAVLLVVVLATVFVTCPVRKAIKVYQGLPVQTKDISSRPAIVHHCPVVEEQVSLSKNEKQVYNLHPRLLTGSNMLYANPVTLEDYQIAGGVFPNGPPLFLRQRKLLI